MSDVRRGHLELTSFLWSTHLGRLRLRASKLAANVGHRAEDMPGRDRDRELQRFRVESGLR